MSLKLASVKQTRVRPSEAKLHTFGPNWFFISNRLTCKILSRVGVGGGGGWGGLSGNKANQ